MFGMGPTEIILILALALIVIGPKKLPDLAKSLGRAMGEFKKAASDFKDTVSMESTLNEVKDEFKEIGNKVREPFDMTSTTSDTVSNTESSSKTDDTDSGDATDNDKDTEESEPPNPYNTAPDQTIPEDEKVADAHPSPESGNTPSDTASSDTPQEGQLKDA